MRKIKFRVWNGETMISPDYITREGLAFWKENSIPSYSDKIMQFTGLLDKNGKEIYDGDIIKEMGCDDYFEVVFAAGAFWLKDKKGPDLFISGDGLLLEVICNIHENPELLK